MSHPTTFPRHRSFQPHATLPCIHSTINNRAISINAPNIPDLVRHADVLLMLLAPAVPHQRYYL